MWGNIENIVGELRTLAQSCNFCTCLNDTLIRDRIVLGIRDGGTRKRLLRQGVVHVRVGLRVRVRVRVRVGLRVEKKF